MKYQIPLKNLEKLQKKVNRIINKGAPIRFEVGEDCLIPFNPTMEPNKEIYIKGKEVTVEGEYIINGWRFVATLEHKESGNIVRCIDPELEGRIPERFRTCAPHCEHCNQARHRKDTYLIRNESTGEFKQVGKTCLMEYTDGLSAEVCAEICSCVPFCEDASRVYGDEISFYGDNCPYINSIEVKRVAYPYVKSEGYQRGVTTGIVASMAFTGKTNTGARPELASLSEIAKVDAWVESLDANNDYLKNAKVAWQSKHSEYRDVALIASLINSYFKEAKRNQALEAAKSNPANEHIGKEGDKVVFRVASVRTLYSKGSYSYYGPEVRMLEIHDDKGRAILWSTSSHVSDGDIIQARIKSLGEYKGVKQTVVTRGTFLYHSDIYEGEYNDEEEQGKAYAQAHKALDAFLSLLEH